jgi:hypothetical protein
VFEHTTAEDVIFVKCLFLSDAIIDITHAITIKVSRKTKILTYKTPVRPVLTYASETWTMTRNDERRLSIFERKILRRINGPICERGQWRKTHNRESDDLYDEPNIVNVTKSNRLRWTGHVARKSENETPKKVTYTNPGGQRGRGRPKSRWTDGVEEDARKAGCGNWLAVDQGRGRRRRVLGEAVAHLGLYSR